MLHISLTLYLNQLNLKSNIIVNILHINLYIIIYYSLLTLILVFLIKFLVMLGLMYLRIGYMGCLGLLGDWILRKIGVRISFDFD